MGRLLRDPGGHSGKSFDLIVVGGGVYGAMLLLEAARAGLHALLLERDDFGGATSSSHFRIGHGGFRYLQTMNLRRFRRAVRERRWLISTFPELVEPLRCVMPLYGEGLRRPYVMRVALGMNDVLSADRNLGVPPERWLSGGTVIGPSAVLDLFPMLPEEGLQGAAVWYDTTIRHSNRILVEALRWASEYGAIAQNYVEVTEVIINDGTAAGVVAVDREAGVECIYHAKAIVNATGPWSRNFGRRVDRDFPSLFRKSRAWNVVFNRVPIGEEALAVKPPGCDEQTYFLHARAGKLFVGTGHASCDSAEESPHPSKRQLATFIEDVNRALPVLDLSRTEVQRVYAGFLPVKEGHSTNLLEGPVFIDHGQHGGPDRFYSVSGVKYTTARYVADKTVRHIQGKPFLKSPLFTYDEPRSVRTDYQLSAIGKRWHSACESIIREEAVQHLSDLVLRRTDLGDYPVITRALLSEIASLFPWSEDRKRMEIHLLLSQLQEDEGTAVKA